ncbi:phage tail protein [Paraburkholderia phenoliruptrix]|nr:phage tail protein [Paraburkholderia phenoliruptrix]MBW9132935.1 phage tail protein [Paraburkholderia ginsengiterrae]
MLVNGASATGTFTADEIVLATALGAQKFVLPSFSETINLASTGAGGMDTGAAPVSGFVALYAIYNPSTQAAALLATDASSAVQPNVYGGAHMPSGYTASALISIWPTDGSGQLAPGYQRDRKVYFSSAQVLNTSTQQASLTSFSMAAAVPKNAKACDGIINATFTTAGAGVNASLAATASGIGKKGFSTVAAASAGQESQSFEDMPIIASQTGYYAFITTSGSSTLTISAEAFSF